MPLRLLGFVIILVVFVLFISLNLENRCDIRFWVTEAAILQNVPVYLTAFSSFIVGILCTFPLMFLFRFKKKKQEKNPRSLETGGLVPKKKRGKQQSQDIQGDDGTP
ncbi:MAG: hypothetical protein LBL76_02925 [Treponema sp.]|nr:hypothetical protein [Treponema sp.]